MDVGNVDRAGEQRGDFAGGEAGDAAADAGHKEGQLGMTVGETDEVIHVGFDGVHTALHGGDGIALALQTNALTHDGAKSVNS